MSGRPDCVIRYICEGGVPRKHFDRSG